MKLTIIITLVMIALVGFVGVVSAEVGNVIYDYEDMLSDTTSTYSAQVPGGNPTVIESLQFFDITDYPDVFSIVVGVKDNFHVDDATDIKKNVGCSFTAKIDGNVIGHGWYSAYRTLKSVEHPKASSKAVITYEFDSWNVSGYSGQKCVDITYSDNDERLSCYQGGIENYPEYPVSRGIVRVYSFSPDSWYPSHPLKGVVTVNQKVLFNQKMSYFYDPDYRSLDIDFYRNGYVNSVNVTNQLDEVLLRSKSGDDMKLYFQNITYVLVTVENPVNGETWQNKIPLSLHIYDIIKENKDAVFGNITDYDIDLNKYRSDIIAIPIIGNMSVPYLDFVDAMYNDAYDMAKNVIDMLMFPVDYLNQNLLVVIDILQDTIDDTSETFDLITMPMLKVINAVPEKVMGVFVFILGLDIIKIVLAWRV